MLNDSLIQLGKEFQEDREDINHVTRRVTRLDPIVEKTKDKITPLNHFYMEFYTYGESSVFLDVKVWAAPRHEIYG